MTLAEFVEHKFIPEHVALKETSGRTHYQSMLKHVLRPDEVDRLFSVHRDESKRKLNAVPNWPYLSDVRLCDAGPAHIEQLTSAALAQGYAHQTVTHIRNVVSAIFSHAKREQCLMGDNPVTLAQPLKIIRKENRGLTFVHTKQALSLMKHPEKDMMLMILFTGMNISEICGLQWKHMNLAETSVHIDGDTIPPRTIAVRSQWFRSEFKALNGNRVRNIAIPAPLLPGLLNIRVNSRFNSPDDFVFASRVGTPANQTNIKAKRLKPIARELGLSVLSWQAFLRTRKALLSEFGMQFQNAIANLACSAPLHEAPAHREWRCRTHSFQRVAR